MMELGFRRDRFHKLDFNTNKIFLSASKEVAILRTMKNVEINKDGTGMETIAIDPSLHHSRLIENLLTPL